MDGSTLVCEGTVCGIEYKEGTQYLYLNHLKFIFNTEISVKYRIKIITKEKCQVELGNKVRASGIVLLAESPSNEGQFDSLAWQRTQKILFTLKKAKVVRLDSRCFAVRQMLFLFRQGCMKRLLNIMSREDAGIVGAMLLGDKSELDENIRSWYQTGGISHILAISGLHISMLGMFLYKILRKPGFPFWFCSMLSGISMLFYAVMTGAGTATCRAVVMFLVFLGAQCFGRTYDLANALSLAVLLLLVSNPLLLFTSGFQLSVLAVAGLAFLQPVLKKAYGEKFPSGVSVQIVIFPCILWHFYTFPVYGMLLNFLVLPLLPVVLAGGLAALFLSVFCMPLACMVGFGIHGILLFYQFLCRLSFQLPFADMVMGRPPVWAMAGYYGVLLWGIAVLDGKRKEKFRMAAPVFLAAAGFMLQRPDFPGLRLSFLDVGQGDCIFIQNEKGVRILCDGGSSSVGKVGQYRILPFLLYHGVSELDYVMLTHMDMDHICGVKEILETESASVRIGTLILPKLSAPDESCHEMEELAEKKGVPVRYMQKGDCIHSGKLGITCMHPAADFRSENKNENSLVLHVQYGSFDAMLMGDLEKAGEEFLLAGEMPGKQKGAENEIEVLKVGHHGSGGATSEKLLEILEPQLAVLSYGKNNRYGHPAFETLERLEKYGCHTVSTEKQGEITVFCDKNEKITIRYEKNVIK